MPTTSTATVPLLSTATVDRAWVATEFAKGIDAEKEMARDARIRAETPPEAALGVLYGQIAEADDRHRAVVETVAVRYGHNPGQGLSAGIGEAIGHLKDKVTSIGTSAMEKVAHDLAAKANAIHWYTAWTQAFQSVGDTESARELAAVLTEESSHREALQKCLDRLVERGTRGDHSAA